MGFVCVIVIKDNDGAILCVRKDILGMPVRMWDTFYGHNAYIQITFVICQELK